MGESAMNQGSTSEGVRPWVVVLLSLMVVDTWADRDRDPSPGEMVLFRGPADRAEWLVKRCRAVDTEGMVGKVLFRIWPPPSAGRRRLGTWFRRLGTSAPRRVQAQDPEATGGGTPDETGALGAAGWAGLGFGLGAGWKGAAPPTTKAAPRTDAARSRRR